MRLNRGLSSFLAIFVFLGTSFVSIRVVGSFMDVILDMVAELAQLSLVLGCFWVSWVAAAAFFRRIAVPDPLAELRKRQIEEERLEYERSMREDW